MRAALMLAVVLSTACGRWPGPHESERGKIIFWLVNQASSDLGECSDSLEYAQHMPREPPFNVGIAWYFIYVVQEDGRSAVLWDCRQYDWTNCWPDPRGIVLSVEGSVLTYEGEPAEVRRFGSCVVQASYRAALTDNGGRLSAEQSTEFNLIGPADDCAEAEQRIRAESFNGKGLDGCRGTVHIGAVYSHVRAP